MNNDQKRAGIRGNFLELDGIRRGFGWDDPLLKQEIHTQFIKIL
jgi:hypothetical protein